MTRTTTAITLFLSVTVVSFLYVAPASARGAAVNIMNSPGYQRALEESRKRQAEPYLKKPAVYPRKKWQQRGRRN